MMILSMPPREVIVNYQTPENQISKQDLPKVRTLN